jgi:hypothetical protein
MHKGYWIVSGKFLNNIEKLLENVQIMLISVAQEILLAGCEEKSEKWDPLSK